MWPFVSRREHEAVLADRERIRGERDQFKDDRDRFKYAAESVSEKYTDVCIVNELLTDDLAKAKEQLAEGTPGEWKTKALAEKDRADLLQAQLDDARLLASRLTAAAETRQQLDDQQRPVDAAPAARKEAVSARLRRERDRVRRLEQRLSEMQVSHVADTRELHDLRQKGADS